MTSCAAIVDASASAPLLVVGSLPPKGRDLDLLAPPGDAEALAAALSRAGFIPRGSTWARFEGCGAEIVDLISVDDWNLPADEVEALFAQARRLPGFELLREPAPEHTLLILARRLVRAGGDLGTSAQARLAEAARDDPNVWNAAKARAPAWRAEHALGSLARSVADGQPVGRAARASALGEGHALARGAGWVDLVGRRARRRQAACVVAFSGLDGAGKTTQANALKATLESAGIPVVVVWTSLIAHGALGAVANPIKRILGFLPGLFDEVHGEDETWSEGAPMHRPDHGTHLRRRSGLVTSAWTLIAALANAHWQRRATLPHLRAQRVVICDRYTLDTKVHFRYEYGRRRSFRLQVAIIRWLSPTPKCGFFLDISPETSFARKGEYTVPQIEVRADLYREEYARFGAMRLDGERPREELCAEIAREVWQALE
jgi:thymidylate kinase